MPLPSERTRISNAKRVATQAINRAAQLKATGLPSRSTAARNAYKVKADALDHVARILAGKPGKA